MTDNANGNPLKGVKVTIRETGQSAKTDSSGQYTITDIRAGDIQVTATKRSYATQNITVTMTVTMSEAGKVVNFKLVN